MEKILFINEKIVALNCTDGRDSGEDQENESLLHVETMTFGIDSIVFWGGIS